MQTTIRHQTTRDYGPKPQVLWIRHVRDDNPRIIFADLCRGIDGWFHALDEPMSHPSLINITMGMYDRRDYLTSIETRAFMFEAAKLEDDWRAVAERAAQGDTVAEHAVAEDERMRAVFNRAFGDMDAAIDEFFDDPHGGQVLLLQVKVLRASVDYLINRQRRTPL